MDIFIGCDDNLRGYVKLTYLEMLLLHQESPLEMTSTHL